MGSPAENAHPPSTRPTFGASNGGWCHSCWEWANYDGWIALPEAVRQKLKLSTGDQLDLELSGETVTLRRSAAAPAPHLALPSSQLRQRTKHHRSRPRSAAPADLGRYRARLPFRQA